MLGERACEKLHTYGIETIRDLQRANLRFLQAIFGKNGKLIWERANGIDDAEVAPHSDRKSISTEHTFNHNITNVRTLESTLISMTEELAFKLRAENKLTSCLAIKIRYGNFETHTVQQKINYTSAEHILIPGIKQLLQQVWHERRPVRLIGVRLSQLCAGSHQINLFEDSEEQLKLYQAMDSINFKYGKKTVCRAAGMEIAQRNFNPFLKA